MSVALAEPRPIREFEDVERRRFLEEIRPLGQPAVLRGLVASWPAVAAGRQSPANLVAYLKQRRSDKNLNVLVAPPETEGHFFYTEDMTGLNFTYGPSTLDAVLDRLVRDVDNPRPYAVAVQSEPVAQLLPGFREENDIDLLDPSVIPRAWIGNAVRVAPHYDLKENIGCVVAGHRRFLLFPPEQLANLYPGPFELTPAGTPVSLVDPRAPDLDRFPAYAEAMETAQAALLAPGDAIYIPYHWWHGVDSLDSFNLLVNYWWNPAMKGLGSPYDAFLFSLYALRHLPPDQRDVWRKVFDHYVFCTGGDPARHIPANARGVLGEPTPPQLAQMRAMLKQILERL